MVPPCFRRILQRIFSPYCVIRVTVIRGDRIPYYITGSVLCITRQFRIYHPRSYSYARRKSVRLRRCVPCPSAGCGGLRVAPLAERLGSLKGDARLATLQV
eukprot:1717506-Pyramimonas_sp.AAC.2